MKMVALLISTNDGLEIIREVPVTMLAEVKSYCLEVIDQPCSGVIHEMEWEYPEERELLIYRLQADLKRSVEGIAAYEKEPFARMPYKHQYIAEFTEMKERAEALLNQLASITQQGAV